MGTVPPLERDRTSRAGPTINGGGPALRLSAGLVAALDREDERTLSLVGRLDGTASRALRHLLRGMLRRCTPGMLITVELSAVTTADVSGLSALVVAQRLAAARRCALTLRDPSAGVMAALSAHRLDGIFTVIR
jgi:ABC-type transporter Mla MlaB component